MLYMSSMMLFSAQSWKKTGIHPADRLRKIEGRVSVSENGCAQNLDRLNSSKAYE